MGVLDVIAKPFEPTELPDRLIEILANRGPV
jgi:DNA-binding response OmpR family regulator